MALTCNLQLKPCPHPKPSPSKANQNKPNKPTRADSTRVRGTPSDHLWQQFRHLAQFSTNLPSLKGATKVGWKRRKRGGGGEGEVLEGIRMVASWVALLGAALIACTCKLRVANWVCSWPCTLGRCVAQWNEVERKWLKSLFNFLF